MSKRSKPKSRVTAETVRVIIHTAERDDTEPPGYSSHQGGSFDDAGYTAGRGQFGFRHDIT